MNLILFFHRVSVRIRLSAIVLLALPGCSAEPDNPLVPSAGASEVVLIDPAAMKQLDPVPTGWMHRKFWFRSPMRVSVVTKESVRAVKCETDASGSIFGRSTDIDLTRWPQLRWCWFVEVPISTKADELKEEGDDHPVRFFLRFRDEVGDTHPMEIIWSNKALKRGDWKYLGTFPHWVADGGDANNGNWRSEQADLLDLYRTITKRTDKPRLVFFGLFCDSDETGSRSIAYTSDVRLGRSAQ